MWSHGASGLRWPRSTSFGFLEFEITRKAERQNPPSGISLSLSGPCLLETRRNSRWVAILHLGLEEWILITLRDILRVIFEASLSGALTSAFCGTMTNTIWGKDRKAAAGLSVGVTEVQERTQRCTRIIP